MDWWKLKNMAAIFCIVCYLSQELQHLPGQICFFLYFPILRCKFLAPRIKWWFFVCLSFRPLGKPGNLSHKLFFNLKETKETNNFPVTQKNSNNQLNTQNKGPEWAHLIWVIYHFLLDSEFFQGMESNSVCRAPIITWHFHLPLWYSNSSHKKPNKCQF